MLMRTFLVLASLFIASLFASLSAPAQVPGDGQQEPTYPDSTYYPSDSSYYETDTSAVSIDTAYGGDYEYDESGGMGSDASSFVPGAGFFVGPTFEVTTLTPAKLDPELDGELVLYGIQVYAIIKGWMVGGHWTSATLYDMSTNYDAFEFSYGGFITGYDVEVLDGLSFRLGTLVGGGDLNMIKKRPDLAGLASTPHEILERYRTESFFMLRPGASVGYSPLPFLDLRLAADYLYPIGGSRVHDLKHLTYGLHVMLGFGR
jgi:hypothetical protein